MSYTLADIKRIHSKKLAVLNKIYTAIDGSSYRGTRENRLEKLDNADSVVTENNYTNLSGDNVEDVLESIDSQISEISQDGYKVFSYDVNGNLTNKDVYEDSSLANKLYEFTYTYTGDNLTQITVLRLSDSFTYNKVLSYDVNNNLTTIDLIT